MNRLRIGFRGLLLGSVCGLAFFAQSAAAFVPSVERLLGGLVEANRSAHRNQSLSIRFSLHQIQGSQDQVLGEGEILANPSGLSRLEVYLADGSVERHLLRGSQYLVSRDGQQVASPNFYLFPISVLQAGNEETLESLFRSLKISPESSALKRVDGEEAYFIGKSPVRDLSMNLAGTEVTGGIWLAVDGLYPVKLRLEQGLSYFLGPELNWGKIRVPSYIDLDGNEGVKYRIKIENLEPRDAPVQVFTTDWLQILGK